MTHPVLTMWTIYKSPRDFPGWYVARMWEIRRGAEEPVATARMLQHRDLDALRDMLPLGLTRLRRAATDDPVIVETWV